VFIVYVIVPTVALRAPLGRAKCAQRKANSNVKESFDGHVLNQKPIREILLRSAISTLIEVSRTVKKAAAKLRN
jgi:hypothetical protein